MAKTLILITGANQGLGYHAAQQLAATGNHRVLVGSRDLNKAVKAIESMATDGPYGVNKDDLEPIQIDVTSDESINAAAAQVEAKYEKLDMLLNNAGIAHSQLATANQSLRESYQEHYDTNLFGAVVVLETFLPLLRKGSSKRIAFTSSGLASLQWASQSESPPSAQRWPLYRSTKTAMSMIMLFYVKTLESEGFVVSAADPGHCGTNLNNFAGKKDPRDGAKVLLRSLLGKKEDVHAATINETGKLPW